MPAWLPRFADLPRPLEAREASATPSGFVQTGFREVGGAEYPPIQQFGHVEFGLRRAGYFVDPTELLELLA
jgi:hypothetical protein